MSKFKPAPRKPLAEMAREWLRGTFGMEDRWDGQPWDDKDAASLTALLERVASEAHVEMCAVDRFRLKTRLADAQKETERLKFLWLESVEGSTRQRQRAEKAEAAVERLKVSMLGHFQREHLEGDGPEIDRWKLKLERAEAVTRPLVEALRFVRDAFVCVDNGHCSVCHGYWPNEHRKECIGNMIRAVLAAHEERTPPQPQAEVPPPHLFTPCEKENEGLLGHNFTCMVLCDICGQPEASHRR